MNKTLEYYLSLPYRLEIIPDTVDGGYGACYPELPGCATCADTLEEVIKNAEDAKREWLLACLEDNIDIPEPTSALQYSGNFKLRMPKSLHESLALHLYVLSDEAWAVTRKGQDSRNRMDLLFEFLGLTPVIVQEGL